jgi:L-iditol 2-dehydrogenase
MLAARLQAVDGLRVEEVPTPTEGPGEVLVEVGANTVCGTDLRIVRDRPVRLRISSSRCAACHSLHDR